VLIVTVKMERKKICYSKSTSLFTLALSSNLFFLLDLFDIITGSAEGEIDRP
jgi:hypothetical protein